MANTRGGERFSTVTSVGEKIMEESFKVCWRKEKESAKKCLLMLGDRQSVTQWHSPPPRSPLCAQKAVQIARGENKRTPNKVRP